MKRALFLIALGVIGLAACGGGTTVAQPTPTFTLALAGDQRTIAECTAQSQPAPEMVFEGEHVVGGDQGYSVTMIVYNDFACPTCQTTEWALTDALLYYPKDVRLVYRHFSDLNNVISVMAAKAAEAAGLQGKFWEMHTLLFDRQEDWLALDGDVLQDWLVQQAVELNLDPEQFQADSGNQALALQVAEQSQQALLLGQPTAPVVLVNGNPIPMYVDTVASFYYWLENLMIPSGRLVNKQFDQCPAVVIEPDVNYTATLHTEKGEIVIALYPDKAPFAVNSFIFLAQNDFYDQVSFFQVIEGSLALTGDPSGTGWGNPGYLFSLEVGPEDAFDRPGLVAMWNSGPTSNGSQFFITYAPLPEFNGQYTIFGEVISGTEVLNSLTPRNAQIEPLAPLGDIIEDVSIEIR
jgi:cyclophilin family peptidyl-prolyl cis-trans isomerase/protein-disulfide isomerase